MANVHRLGDYNNQNDNYGRQPAGANNFFQN
jgi:hypothetical protein